MRECLRRTVELDVASDASVEAGIAKLIAKNGRLDAVMHHAGHMSFGPAEAFTPVQFADTPPSRRAAGRDAREGCGPGRRGDARPGLREGLRG